MRVITKSHLENFTEKLLRNDKKLNDGVKNELLEKTKYNIVKIVDFKDKLANDDWAVVLNYMISEGYRNIEIPSGQYEFKTPVYMVDGLRITGQYGKGFNEAYKTTIVVTTTAFTFKDEEVQHNEITIENILFKQGESVIDFGLCHCVSVRKCSFIDFSKNGIILTRGERLSFEDIDFWSKSVNFDKAFCFADKSESTLSSIRNMTGTMDDDEWVDRITINNVVAMKGTANRFNSFIHVGGILSNATLSNITGHGGKSSYFYAKRVQLSSLNTWVIDDWGSASNPCEKLIYIHTIKDSNINNISPAFSANSYCNTQFYIDTTVDTVIQNSYSTGDNVSTFGFKVGANAGQMLTMIGCRGAFFSESTSELHRTQIAFIGCHFDVTNCYNLSLPCRDTEEVHNFMSDRTGEVETNTDVGVRYIRTDGAGAIRNFFRILLDRIIIGHNGSQIISGKGSPEGVVTACVGSMYLDTEGSTGSTLYVKETGEGNTGWISK